jgi:hypothetical protein
MRRHDADDRFDDEDDTLSNRSRKANGGFPVWAIVVLCAVPIFAVVAIGGAIAMFTMRASHADRAEAQAVRVESRTAVAVDRNGMMVGPGSKAKTGTADGYTRDEFKALVGSTPEAVTATVGPPSFRLVDGTRSTWHYHNLTKEPATGQIDAVTKVVFDGGVVVDVYF